MDLREVIKEDNSSSDEAEGMESESVGLLKKI